MIKTAYDHTTALSHNLLFREILTYQIEVSHPLVNVTIVFSLASTGSRRKKLPEMNHGGGTKYESVDRRPCSYNDQKWSWFELFGSLKYRNIKVFRKTSVKIKKGSVCKYYYTVPSLVRRFLLSRSWNHYRHSPSTDRVYSLLQRLFLDCTNPHTTLTNSSKFYLDWNNISFFIIFRFY